MYELRGIEISYHAGDRHIKLIVRVGYGDIYKVHKQVANIPVNQGTIRAMAAGAFGQKPGDLTWPHHIEAPNLKGGP